VRAFEAYALDYLLKPFDAPRLVSAIDRARASMDRAAAGTAGDADPRLTGLLRHVQRELWEKHPESIAIKSGDQYTVIPIADVDWIEADGNHTKLYINKRPRLLTKTLATLEKEVLDPEVFVRVHRSAIVNASRIASAEPNHQGDLTLVLRD